MKVLPLQSKLQGFQEKSTQNQGVTNSRLTPSFKSLPPPGTLKARLLGAGYDAVPKWRRKVFDQSMILLSGKKSDKGSLRHGCREIVQECFYGEIAGWVVLKELRRAAHSFVKNTSKVFFPH